MVRIKGTNHADTLLGTVGESNRIEAQGGDDWVIGAELEDRIWGGRGRDFLDGREGNDWLNGGQGGDHIDAGAGDDLVIGGGGDDEIYLRDGTDVAYGGAGNDIITGNDGMFGGSANDYLDGGAGDDYLASRVDTSTLIGGRGNDWLELDSGWGFGGDGNDVFTARLGRPENSRGLNVVLDNGAGADTDIISTWADGTPAWAYIEFGQEDRIDITATVFSADFVVARDFAPWEVFLALDTNLDRHLGGEDGTGTLTDGVFATGVWSGLDAEGNGVVIVIGDDVIHLNGVASVSDWNLMAIA